MSKLSIPRAKIEEHKRKKFVKQNENNAKYWHQRSDKDGRIDWKNMNALQVHNFIRALTKPYDGAYTFYKNKKIRIFVSELSKKKFYGTPGRVVKIKNNNLLVICSDYGLYITDYAFEEPSFHLSNAMYLI